MTKIVLYHGSNMPVLIPEVRSKGFHDFGKALYLTTSVKQAKRWAFHKAKKSTKAYVSCYTISSKDINNLQILEYKKPDKAWLNLIIKCRQKGFEPKSDIIIGPVMDGRRSWVTLSVYENNEISINTAIQDLKPYILKDQWAFKNKTALSYLKFEKVMEYEKKIH